MCCLHIGSGYQNVFFFFLIYLQLNFNGSNPDGMFTLAVSNSSLSPLEKIQWLQIYENLG